MAVTTSVSNKCNSLSAFDENFGMAMDFNNLKRQFREWIEKQSTCYPVAKNSDSGSTVTTLNDKFQVTIDVYQFKSEEITIKVIGSNTICIEGNHEEQHEDCGFVSRHFVRKYTVPNGYDITKVVSTLSSDGILRIIAPCNGQTIDDYRNVAIQQTNVSSQNTKHAQHNESNLQKCFNSRNEVPVQRTNVGNDVSVHLNQQTHHNRKENSFNSAQTTREFEETHNYIQQFLKNIDNKYRVVPIHQVGPFSKLDESSEETRLDVNSQQRQETYLKQKECRTVPIQQTTATYTSSFETESKKQVGSSRTPESQYRNIPIDQTKVTEINNERLENVKLDRKCSIDKEEKYVQKEIVQEYRTVPIQQTQSSNIKMSTQNFETNASQEYKTIPIERTGIQTQQDRSQEKIHKNTSTIEETTTCKNEQQIHDNNYKTIPIQQTGIVSQVSHDETHKRTVFKNSSIDSECKLKNTTGFEKTENWECNNEQLRDQQHKVQNIATTQEINKHDYKTIPIQQTHVVLQETNEQKVFTNNSNSQRNNKCITDMEETENWKTETNKTQNLEDYKHFNDINYPPKNVQSIDEITWEIQNQQSGKTVPKKEVETVSQTYEQRIFKNSSIDSQYNVKNTTDFDETQRKEFKTIPIQQTSPDKFHEQKECNMENVKLVKEENTYRSSPIEQTGITSQVTKHENYDQKIFKNNSIDSQCTVKDFQETENWRQDSQTVGNNISQEREHRKNSQTGTYEQDLSKTNFRSTNDTNKKSNDNELQNNSMHSQQSEKHSSSSKTSKYTEEASINSQLHSRNLLQSSKNEDHLQYGSDHSQTNKHVTPEVNEQNVSSVQSNRSLLNSKRKDELVSQNQRDNLVFQESDSSKEEIVGDGYKQSGLTNKNARAEFVAYPDGFKMTKEQSFYSEQSKTKEWNSNKNDQLVDGAQNNAYQVQCSVDSNSSERFSRMPSETSEICIEEITEENETKKRSGGSSGYRKHETSQFVSNSDHTVHVQHN